MQTIKDNSEITIGDYVSTMEQETLQHRKKRKVKSKKKDRDVMNFYTIPSFGI